jgi:hypothetical protein
MRKHLHNASWQDTQFEKRKQLVNDNTAVVIYDFARNVATLHQDEVKSSAFAKNQIIIHPIPMYFLDPVSKCIMRETLVITSDDITHDSQAVSAFRKAAVKHLIEKRSVSLKNLIEWSDGCEYKGVYAFKGTVEDAKVLGIKITSCFFGSEHGKGESDGETTVIISLIVHNSNCCVHTCSHLID